MKRTRAAFAAVALFCAVLIGTGEDTFAGHPFGTEDAGTQGKGNVAGSYEIRKEWYLLSELLWETQTSPSAPSSSEWLIGGKKEITDTLSVDAGIRWGLNGDSPHVTYLLGFTLGFRGEPSAQAATALAGDRK